MKHSNMSHNGTSSGGDDLGSTDEVKIFKDEGDREEEKNSSENLYEEKSSLIDLTESEFASFQKKNKTQANKSDNSTPVFGKLEQSAPNFNMGYLMSHYGSYPNGSGVSNKMGLPQFFCHSNAEASLTTPPPAHCGIPPYQLDPKMIGLAGRPFFAASPYPYPILSPEISPPQLGPSWHTPSVYASANFKNPYSGTDFPFRFSPNIYHNPGNAEGLVVGSHQQHQNQITAKQENINNYNNNKFNLNRNIHQPELRDTNKTSNTKETQNSKDSPDKKRVHIKKPLNAFMLYMKEMRAKVVSECTLKESAAINKILGQKWHELSRDEQSKYYEKARRERQLHMELYPGWSARDNYGYVSKKKKHKKDRQPSDSLSNTMKKCRARFGLDQQSKWCKPCRRKKKCIFYTEVQKNENCHSDRQSQKNESGENYLGSCSSADEIKSPDDDEDSYNQSMSSPGGLSNLSSLQSPATSIASHSNQITSPPTPSSCQGDVNQQITNPFIQTSLHQKELLSPNSNFISQSLPRQHTENELFQNKISFNSKINEADIAKLKRNEENDPVKSIINESIESPQGLKEPNSPIDDKSIINKIIPSIVSLKSQNEIKSTPNSINSQTAVIDNMKDIVPSTMTSIKSFSPIFEDGYPNILTPKNDKSTSSPSPVIRNPVGANPRDINNPLNIKQLTNRNDNLRNNASPNSNSGLTILQTPNVCSAINSTATYSSSTSISTENYSFSHLDNSFLRQQKSLPTLSLTTPVTSVGNYHQMINDGNSISISQPLQHMGNYFNILSTPSDSINSITNQFTNENLKKQTSTVISNSDHIHKTIDSSSKSETTGKSGPISVT